MGATHSVIVFFRRPELFSGILAMSGVYDARLFFIELIQKAKQRILVIDPYADRALLSLLREKKREVSLTIISGGVSRLNEEDRSAFAEQYGPFDYRVITDVHDRFLLIDESMYLLGASFNAIGKRLFGVVELASASLKQSLLTHVSA